ncbi:MAG: hypothetical protein R2864_08800 [Syntrophotaleaceae bacterium]
MQPVAETGRYQAALYLVPGRQVPGPPARLHRFSGSKFQPDTLQIQRECPGRSGPGLNFASSLTAQVRLRNLFGAPAQGRKVSAVMKVRSSRFQFKEYRDFTFADPWYDPDQPALEVSEELPVAVTDGQGQAQFTCLWSLFEGHLSEALDQRGFEPGPAVAVSPCGGCCFRLWRPGRHPK